MAQPYSSDLRERVLAACERGQGSQVEIAWRFRVCPATVSNWRRQARQEGRRSPKAHAGGVASRLDEAALTVLRALVDEDNDATLAEYARRLAERTGKQVSTPVLCRTLKRLELTRKKRRYGRLSRTEPRSQPSAKAIARR